MVAKAFFIFCASALLVQTISAQCGCGYGGLNGAALGNGIIGGIGGCGYGPVYGSQIASGSGGCLSVSSASPIAPNGISVVSDNAIEGVLDVNGQLPLLAAVAFEGNLPTAGSAGTVYSCGNGNVGISGESLAAAGIGASGIAGYGGLGLANGLGLGNGIGLANAGYGLANAGYGLANAGCGLANAGYGLAGSRLNAGNSCGCGNIYY